MKKSVLFLFLSVIFVLACACIVLTYLYIRQSQAQYVYSVSMRNGASDTYDAEVTSVPSYSESGDDVPAVKININTASKEELQTLPGIGSVIAERIVEYREQNGGFRSIEEIVEVKGIGESILNSIRDMITI